MQRRLDPKNGPEFATLDPAFTSRGIPPLAEIQHLTIPIAIDPESAVSGSDNSRPGDTGAFTKLQAAALPGPGPTSAVVREADNVHPSQVECHKPS
ncbi:hypothetical protein NDU88_001609 [Pleurodeles waltl]|uniref:Uncharacterized protein n=1 Tax=Pleurodeles waltl TaxID=8319 RepID=A0AAV7TKL1_PLEWA|nr:hypothetical protein NDU88_001609 [Pleurodeles waltl]